MSKSIKLERSQEGNASNQARETSLANTFDKLFKNTNDLLLIVNRASANALRAKVAKNMFSPEGGARALRIADGIDPTAQQAEYKNMTSEGKKYGNTQYLTYCALCHQSNGRGIPNSFPALIGAQSLQSKSAVIDVIIRGRKGMPAYKDALSPVQIAAIVTYIQAEFSAQKRLLVNEEDVIEELQKVQSQAAK
jgi:mono/diheme cytochrome c family protein